MADIDYDLPYAVGNLCIALRQFEEAEAIMSGYLRGSFLTSDQMGKYENAVMEAAKRVQTAIREILDDGKKSE